MSYRKKLFLSLSLSFCSSFAVAGDPYKVADNIMATFEYFPNEAWQIASTGLLGNVYILKSDARATTTPFDPSTVHDKLGYIFPSNTVPGKRNILGVNYERVDEPAIGYRNQCVAFAKAMIGGVGTAAWKKGTDLTLLYPNQRAPSQIEAMARLPYGTMIAAFDGNATYPNTVRSHVAIVAGVNADTAGKVLSVTVYSQNGVDSAYIGSNLVALGDSKTTNPTGGTIMKYTIPWSSTSSVPGLSAKYYSIVNKN